LFLNPSPGKRGGDSRRSRRMGRGRGAGG